jgi:WXG100 family type VII secretion target
MSVSGPYSVDPAVLQEFARTGGVEVTTIQAALARLKAAATQVRATATGQWVAAFDATFADLERDLQRMQEILQGDSQRAGTAATMFSDTQASVTSLIRRS